MGFIRYLKSLKASADFYPARRFSLGLWLVMMVLSFSVAADIERPVMLNTVQVSDRLVRQAEIGSQRGADDQAGTQTTSERNKQRVALIERIALQKVMVRIAGVESVLKNELVRSVLEAPKKAIRSSQARPSLGVTQVVVDEAFVKNVLDQSGEAWWKIQRPKIWVRVVHVKDYERSWRGLDEPWGEQVLQALHARGFTAVEPEAYRLGGQQGASEFLGGFWKTYIEEASLYDGYVFVRVAEQQGLATVKVTFNLRGEETELTQQVSLQPGGYRALLNSAFESVVQNLLAVSKSLIDEDQQFTIRVIDAGDLATVSQVEDMLLKLTGPSSVHLKVISPNQVVFSVKPPLGWVRWLKSLRRTRDLDILSETQNEVVVRWLNVG